MFMKATSCINGPYDDIVIPRGSKKTDWEVELGIIIGTKAKYVAEAAALNHVAGYCTVHDVSEREFQIERGGTWDKGKGCDTFGPIGPWLVTKDEVPNPQNLALWLEVDGHRYQNGSTRTMIFPVARLVSYLSQFMTLHPGDMITTGTPSGVGMAQKPTPIFLRPGQTVRLAVEGLGEQQQRIVADQA
jgi:2-keto-4-pentenoate hydratase/2-oxohepta-3-ene-1,7-dioic acid hydratase in catechol pathway